MIIIDASVVNKVFLPNEENHDIARQIIQQHLQKAVEISVPDLLFYEVANTLVTKTTIPEDKILRSLTKLENFKLLVIHPSIDELLKIAQFARHHRISVYDATYAILASEKGCDLFSADSKFVNKVKLPFVKYLGEYPYNTN